jgi:ankyrin repeat protein
MISCIPGLSFPRLDTSKAREYVKYKFECLKVYFQSFPHIDIAFREALRQNNIPRARAIFWKAGRLHRLYHSHLNFRQIRMDVDAPLLHLLIHIPTGSHLGESITDETTDVNEKDSHGYAALHKACMLADKTRATNMVKLLLQHPKIAVNQTADADKGALPIYYAAELGYEEIVDALMNKGSQVPLSAITAAVVNGHIDLAKKMMTRLKINEPTFNWSNLLNSLLISGQTDLIFWIIDELQGQPSIANIIEAINKGRYTLAKTMMEQLKKTGASFDWQALAQEVYDTGAKRRIDSLKWIFENTSICPNADQVEALYTSGKCSDLIKRIVVTGMLGVNTKATSGKNLVQLSAERRDAEMLTLLSQHGADPLELANAAYTAAKQGDLNYLYVLKSLNGLLILPDRETGLTTLHYAAAAVNGSPAIQFLISKGLPVNTKVLGVTPLSMAIQSGHLDNILSLLKNKADPRLLSHEDHLTLLTMALTNERILDVLKRQLYLPTVAS